jgi:aryl-alcohol dehydrogenase-like predicted oxidoreductase
MFRFASNMRKTINERIRLLDPFPIDLYQIHQPRGFSGEEDEMTAMADLCERKFIKAFGVSNFSAKKMENSWKTLQITGIPLASNQVSYSLLDRRIESNGVMNLAKN